MKKVFLLVLALFIFSLGFSLIGCESAQDSDVEVQMHHENDGHDHTGHDHAHTNDENWEPEMIDEDTHDHEGHDHDHEGHGH